MIANATPKASRVGAEVESVLMEVPRLRARTAAQRNASVGCAQDGVGFRVAEDLEDCGALGGAQVLEALARVGTCQHFIQTRVEHALDVARQRVERRRIDDVAQRKTEQTPRQIEIAQ